MSRKITSAFVFTGQSENKRQRKPTKRLLESTEDYEQIFSINKRSKKNCSGSSKVVRSVFIFFTVQMKEWR